MAASQVIENDSLLISFDCAVECINLDTCISECLDLIALTVLANN